MIVKFALCGDTQRKEMETINNCWQQLSPLDTAARYRVLDWLKSWARSEAPDSDRDDF